jgi:hypothetical protein
MSKLEILSDLLKDELAAVATYQQVLGKLREDVALGDAESLFPLLQNHKTAVGILQNQIRELGAIPAEDAGAWGAWTKLVEGGAILLGKQTALLTLQEGEKTGSVDYEQALLDEDLPAEFRSMIETKFLPAQREHIRTLDRLMDFE